MFAVVLLIASLCAFIPTSAEQHQATEATRTTPSQKSGAPYFIRRPHNATALVDTEFVLHCVVAGDPPPTIKWWKIYKEMRRRGSNYRIQKSGNLKFTRVLPQHSGYYRCQGNNEKGKVISDYAYLQVDAPAVIVNGPTNRTVKEGATVHLKCEAVGEPKPVISWTVDGKTMVDPETRRPYNKTFYRFNATVTQRYECTAENKYKKVSQAATVFVIETPKGRCELYSGRMCKNYIGSRLVWYNLSSPANMSSIQELNVLRLWKKLISSVSATCRTAAEAMLCESAFPACDNRSEAPILIPLCRIHCLAVENQFCHESWNRMRHVMAENNITLPYCSNLLGASSDDGQITEPHRKRFSTEACTRIKMFEVHSSQITTICYHGRGDQYNGTLGVTEQNLPCQRWTSHYPHAHPHVTPHVFPILKNAANHCRNPGGLRARPWCYVNSTDSKEQWQYCSVPLCVIKSGNGYVVNGGILDLDGSFTKGTIVMVALVPLIAVSLLIFIAVLCHRACRQRHKYQYDRASQHDLNIDVEKLPYNMSYHQQPAESPMCSTLKQVEYSRNNLVFIEDIGQGAFGRMFKATAPNIRAGEACTTVVVKMLKDDASEDMELDFDREATLLLELDHPNIIKLLGACAIGRPRCLLFEYMSKGDLNEFLRRRSPDQLIARSRNAELVAHAQDQPRLRLSHSDQLGISMQLASAMVYLSGKGYVHRDLATRNCLVGDNLVVKISDFGLTRRVQEESDVYIGSEHDAIPIRWMPIEAILYNQFTFESDVWSFGVVLWEIFSFALQPYYDMDLGEVIKYISEGHVLSCPDDTPQVVYELMKSCWRLQSYERPTFQQIYNRLCALHSDVRQSCQMDRV